MRKLTNIKTTQITNPKLRQVAADFTNEVCLAMEKALANYAEPSVYPISDDSKSLERVCQAYFQTVNSEKRKAMAQKALLTVNAPKDERKQKYGEFAKINLRSKTSIEEQSRQLVPRKLRLAENDLREFNGYLPVHGSHRNSHENELLIRAPEGNGTTLQQLKRLVFRINRVECIKQTDEWGEDEIFLGGTAIDESGNVQKISQFKVGDFEDGDVWNPSQPRSFYSFELSKRIKYPRTYSVVLVLVEEDAGNLTDFLNRLANMVRDKLKEQLREISTEYLGVLLGIVVGWVLGEVVDYLLNYLGSLWGDEIFLPVNNLISLPSPDFSRDSATKTLTSGLLLWEFNGFDGRYWVDCDWQLFTAEPAVV